jgi:hypothetical protein
VQPADFREKATLAYENLKAEIESVDGNMDNINRRYGSNASL